MAIQTEAKMKLTPHDFGIMSSLAQGIIPGGNRANDKILECMPIVLDEIYIDMQAISGYLHKQAYSLKFETPKWENEGAKVYVEENQLSANPIFSDYTAHGPRLNLSSFGLTREDYVEAIKHLADPKTLWNRCIAALGMRVSDRMHSIKGYTIGPNSNKYAEHEGKLYPDWAGVFDMTDEALESARQTAFNEWMTHIHQFKEHCRSIPKGEKFPDLEALCERISLRHNPNRGWGHTSTYASPCTPGPELDPQKRILNPIFHHMSLLERESIVAGCVAVRPILSSGEMVTPEVITKYLS